MRPGSDKLNNSPDRIVLWVDVEEAFNGNALSSWVLTNRTNIVNPKTGTIVGLIGESIDDVKVVIDSLMVGCEECTCCLGIAEVGEIDDVSDGTASSSHTNLINLIEFVVEKNELVPVALSPPALMAVGGTRVRKTRDNLGRWVTVLASAIVDSYCVLIVTDADITPPESTVRPVILDALRIVNVSILASASRRSGLGGILQINVLKTSLASLVTGLCADC